MYNINLKITYIFCFNSQTVALTLKAVYINSSMIAFDKKKKHSKFSNIYKFIFQNETMKQYIRRTCYIILTTSYFLMNVFPLWTSNTIINMLIV
jgi:hypothetical protein